MVRWLDRLTGSIAAVALLFACFSVIARYAAPSLILDWSDELVVMLLIWSMFLSNCRTTLARAHISVDLLTHGRSSLWQRRLQTAATLALAAYAGAMAVAGALVVRDAWRIGERTESTARLPTALYYAALPVGMALVVFACVLLLVRPSAAAAAESEDGDL